VSEASGICVFYVNSQIVKFQQKDVYGDRGQAGGRYKFISIMVSEFRGTSWAVFSKDLLWPVVRLVFGPMATAEPQLIAVTAGRDILQGAAFRRRRDLAQQKSIGASQNGRFFGLSL